MDGVVFVAGRGLPRQVRGLRRQTQGGWWMSLPKLDRDHLVICRSYQFVTECSPGG